MFRVKFTMMKGEQHIVKTKRFATTEHYIDFCQTYYDDILAINDNYVNSQRWSNYTLLDYVGYGGLR